MFFNCMVSIKEKIFGKVEENRNEAESNDFYKELLINPLTDINNKAIQEMSNFQDFNSANFKNYRFEEEPEVESEYYKEILATRVSQIDAIINNHLITANGRHIYELKYQDLEQSEKLDILFEQQQDLQPKGDGKIDNNERLRFEALIQSYDLFNSEHFQSIKPVKNLLEATNNKYRLCHEG